MKNLFSKLVIAAVCCLTATMAFAAVGFTDPAAQTTTKMMNSLVKNYSNWSDYATVWAKGTTPSQTNMLSATETALNKVYKNRDKSIAKQAIVQNLIEAIEATGCLHVMSRPENTDPKYLDVDGKTNITWWIYWDKSHVPVPTPPLSRKANRTR